MQVNEEVQGGLNMASRGHHEACHGLVEPHLEAILGASWCILGASWPKLGPRWSKMGSTWLQEAIWRLIMA